MAPRKTRETDGWPSFARARGKGLEPEPLRAPQQRLPFQELREIDLRRFFLPAGEDTRSMTSSISSFVIPAAFSTAAISTSSFTARERATNDSKPSVRSRTSAPGRSFVSSRKRRCEVRDGNSIFRRRPGPSCRGLGAVFPQDGRHRFLERPLEVRVRDDPSHHAPFLGHVHVPRNEHRPAGGEHEQQRVHGVAREPAHGAAAQVFEVVDDGREDTVARHPLGRARLPRLDGRRGRHDRPGVPAQRAATMFTSLFGTTMTLRISLPGQELPDPLVRQCLLLQLRVRGPGRQVLLGADLAVDLEDDLHQLFRGQRLDPFRPRLRARWTAACPSFSHSSSARCGA